MEPDEYFIAEWYNGNSWIILLNETGDPNIYNKFNTTLNVNMLEISIRFRCSNSANGEWCNVDNVNITAIDLTAPVYDNLTETSDPATYAAQYFMLNATWIDDFAVDTVILEFNGVNYTDITQNGNIFNKTFTNLAVGTYNYKWFANDTSNHWNNTEILAYTITKASSEVNLTRNGIEGNITVEKGSSVNITGQLITGESSIELYQDGTLINSGIAPLINQTTFNTLGTYNITVIYPTSENYTASFETYYVIVTDTTPPTPSTINEPTDPSNYTTDGFNFNATWTDNEAVDTVFIEFNGTNYSTTKDGNVYYTTITKAAGSYNYKWFANDTSNNWNTTASYSFTINKTYVNVSLLLDGTSANITISEGEIVNITGLSGQSSIELYNNGASVNTGASPLINFTTFSTAGTYNITVMYAETENYTANSETHYVIVQSSPSSPSSSGSSSNNNNNDNRRNTGIRKNPSAYTPPGPIAKPKLSLKTTTPQRNPAPEIVKKINAITGLTISDQDELPKSRFFLPLLSMFFLSLMTVIGTHFRGKLSRNHQHSRHMLKQLKKAHRK